MLKAVVFDRDGVLAYVDVAQASAHLTQLQPLSLLDLMKRWQVWGEREGFPCTLEDEPIFLRRFWLALAADFALSDQITEQLIQVNYLDYLRAFDDARPALEAARVRGLRTGVLSNFALASLASSLEVLELSGVIDVACAATVIGASKPQPRAYEIVAAQLGVAPAECLYFDDEPACVAGATAVGMRAILIDRTRSSHDLARGIACDLTAVEAILAGVD